MSLASLANIPTGFAAPARHSQHCFRQLLTAISFPGRLVQLSLPGFDKPALLSDAAAALLTALPDPATSVWLSPSLNRDPVVADYARFHTDCSLFSSDHPAQTELGWAAQDDLPGVSLTDFSAGTDLEPHLSTTLVLDVDALGASDHAGKPRALLALRGPGIKSVCELAIIGLSPAFWQQRIEQQTMFPCGIDLVLTSADRFVALPRTTQIEVLQCT